MSDTVVPAAAQIQVPPPSAGMRLRAREITEADHDAVARLLGKGFQRPSWYYAEVLSGLSRHSTPPGRPKYGVLMEADGSVVGAVLLIFSSLQSGGTTSTRCHVTSWYVEPAYKSYAALFMSRALRHKDVTYINISATPPTRPIILAQGFTYYSSGQYVAVPALCPGSAGGPVKICRDHGAPDAPFEASDRELLKAHAEAGCMSLWCVTPERAWPFVFLPRLFKGVLPGVQLIYCRDVQDIVRFAGPLGRYLAARGKLVISIDSSGPVTGLPGLYIEGRSPRFFKGPHPPRQGDIAYTQAAMFPWPRLRWPWHLSQRPPRK
jgi:hypothetical protein